MQHFRKKLIYTVMIPASLAGLLSGCSRGVTPTSLFREASERMQEVTSSSNRVELDIQLEDVLDLREVNMEMEMENTTEPPAGHAKGTAQVNIVDAEVSGELEIYQVMEDGEYVTYSSLDGDWEREVTEDDSENHIGMNGDIFAQEVEVLEEFHLAEEPVTVEEKECYQMYGDVKGEDLMGLLGKDMISAFGLVDLPSEEAIKELDVPVIFDIYKEELLPARIIVDMSGVLSDLYDSYGETTKVNLYSIELVFTDYDQVEEITVPQEVRGASS